MFCLYANLDTFDLRAQSTKGPHIILTATVTMKFHLQYSDGPTKLQSSQVQAFDNFDGLKASWFCCAFSKSTKHS